jgi:hypothetical protein
MTPHTIPLIHVAGTHREVGAQIGEMAAETIARETAFETTIPGGRTRHEQLALADEYRAVTAQAMPWFLEEV